MPFSDEVKEAFGEIEKEIMRNIPPKGMEMRWLAIKLFERDQNIIDKLRISINTLDEIEVIIKKYEAELDDDSESIVTGDRYAFIGDVVLTAIKKAK